MHVHVGEDGIDLEGREDRDFLPLRLIFPCLTMSDSPFPEGPAIIPWCVCSVCE
jgi:hypothetical protein